jgi:hypothetical protein
VRARQRPADDYYQRHPEQSFAGGGGQGFGADAQGPAGVLPWSGRQHVYCPDLLLETLRAAKAAGAKIILLTHYEDSPGAKLADIVLLCGAQESPLDSGNIPVKVALLYVAEVLVLRYTMDDPENANAAQDRTSEARAVKML